MQTPDFFRSQIDAMINLEDPLAVLSRRMPWAQIEAALAPKFEHVDRPGEVIEGHDLVGPRTVVVGAGRSNAGRPKLPVRLMASLSNLNARSWEWCERSAKQAQGRGVCGQQPVGAC